MQKKDYPVFSGRISLSFESFSAAGTEEINLNRRLRKYWLIFDVRHAETTWNMVYPLSTP